MLSTSPEETMEIAGRLAAKLPEHAVIALHGQLGSGKTCFVRGLALALGVETTVTSPTFTLIQEYAGSRPLIHVDLYRIENPGEVPDIGFEEYLERPGLVAVEWAERAGDLLPPHTVHVELECLAGEDQRSIRIRSTLA